MSSEESFFNIKDYDLREISRNRVGGRITYVGLSNKNGKKYIFKCFRFAGDASWSGYEIHQREIRILQSLNHPAIPKYVSGQETSDGFVLIQEYKDAPNLASLIQHHRFSFDEIKKVTKDLLGIFTYLHEEAQICHGDVKPENILVDFERNPSVYLIDFGLARSDGGSVAATSLVAGTPGFIPPDQVFQRELIPSSDLYGLGATLISLLTETASIDITKLIDSTSYRFKFHTTYQGIPNYFLKWVERLVAPSTKRRFNSARFALQSLEMAAKAAELSTKVNWIRATSLSAIGGLILWGTLFGLQDRSIQEKNEALQTLSSQTDARYTEAVRRAEELAEVERQRQEAERQHQEELAKQREAELEYRRQQATIKRREKNLRTLLERGECSRCDLQGMSLVSRDLSAVNLSGADLTNADLTSTALQGANLKGTVLTNANLENANLREASLVSAQLFNADLSGVVLEGANLRGANLENASLSGSNIKKATFEEANLTDANLKRADGTGATFQNANLSKAGLSDAIFESANFFQANLSEANLGGTNLSNANLERANVTLIWFLRPPSLEGTTLPNGEVCSSSCRLN